MKDFLYILISIFSILPVTGQTQNAKFSLGIWHFTSLSGEAGIKGFYRQQQSSLLSGTFEKNSSLYFSGISSLKTQSYIWHPNFLLLDIEAAYNPETRNETFLVIPDRSENRALQKLNISGTFFSRKPLSLTAYLKLNKNYVNYENLSNVKYTGKYMGASLTNKNQGLPFSLGINKRQWRQQEIMTNRTFDNDQTNFKGKVSKSFSEYDESSIYYTHSNISRINAEGIETQNTIDRARFTNTLADKTKKYSLRTGFSQYIQKGTNNFDRFRVREQLILKLPQNIRYTSAYQFNNTTQQFQNYKQHLINGRLNHKLFLSLESELMHEYYKILHSAYSEENNRSSIHFKYSKKIPLDGRLRLSYQYLRHRRNNTSEPVVIRIENEEYTLSDDQVILLRYPSVEYNSITVTDENGTVIYQNNLDYLIIERENYFEIQRIPGGQIQDGDIVFIDYRATTEGSYQYTLHNSTFGVNLSLWNQFIELYYRNNTNDYKNIDGFDAQNLNFVKKNIFGSRITYKPISSGVEYTSYNSTIIPYNLLRLYIIFQHRFGERLRFSVNGNMRYYEMLNEGVDQRFADISGKVAYRFNRNTDINLDVGYRNQKGQGIDLNLLTARAEFTKKFRKLFLTAGLETYQRDYLGEIINFKGLYIQIIRKF